jgi:hypothetical protein
VLPLLDEVLLVPPDEEDEPLEEEEPPDEEPPEDEPEDELVGGSPDDPAQAKRESAIEATSGMRGRMTASSAARVPLVGSRPTAENPRPGSASA